MISFVPSPPPTVAPPVESVPPGPPIRRFLNNHGRNWIKEEPGYAIPDAHLLGRFRGAFESLPNNGSELAGAFDTRYLQPLLYFLARTHHAKTIVEIGSGLGGSLLPLLKAADEMGGLLYSVDPQFTVIAQQIGSRYQTNAWRRCETTSDAFFAPGGDGHTLAIDFAFVDGDHLCGAVIRDARNVLDRLVPGGMVVFHEWDGTDIPPWETMRDRVKEARSGDPRHHEAALHGTPRALREVLGDYDVDTMSLQFGACGLDRTEDWTEAGAMLVRKRFPGEFHPRPGAST